MSTRSTIFLTDDGGHWHEDVATYSKDSTPENPIFNVHISIGKNDVVDMEYCEIDKTWFFEIDGNSELARAIKKLRWKD
jgi:hypothetical protein